MGQYEKHESGILDQRAECIYKNKIKKRKGQKVEHQDNTGAYRQCMSLYE